MKDASDKNFELVAREAATDLKLPVRNKSKDSREFYGYAYSFDLDSTKTVRNVSLPSNDDVLVFALTLVPPRCNPHVRDDRSMLPIQSGDVQLAMISRLSH